MTDCRWLARGGRDSCHGDGMAGSLLLGNTEGSRVKTFWGMGGGLEGKSESVLNLATFETSRRKRQIVRCVTVRILRIQRLKCEISIPESSLTGWSMKEWEGEGQEISEK